MMITADLESSTQNQPEQHFAVGACVRHLKTMGVYVVLAGPDKIRHEADAQPGYAYQAVSKVGVPEGPIWIRTQVSMEDGRFAAAPGVKIQWHGSQGHLFMTPEQEGIEVGMGVRFVARVMSKGSSGVDGGKLGQHAPSPTIEWDCTEFVMAQYTDAERSELVLDPDTLLADTLREDPGAPKELSGWSGDCKLRVFTR